jgi:hypothetical protein
MVAACVAGCGGPQIPPAQNYGTITGRAFDSSSNQPVAGVVVTVDTILIATTGSDGSYRIPNIPLGSYSLFATAPQGYQVTLSPSYASGSIAAGQTIPIDIPLTKQ